MVVLARRDLSLDEVYINVSLEGNQNIYVQNNYQCCKIIEYVKLYFAQFIYETFEQLVKSKHASEINTLFSYVLFYYIVSKNILF